MPDARLSNKYYAPMHKLRLEIFNAPHKKWGVEQMAQSVYISPSYFQHLYKELFGISCIQDIIRARLKNACFYLCTTEMSIHALADFCGYENELHFMRQFKKQLGMTPSQYREQHRHSSP
jgi:AraC family transcriptional regulator of arabinose operon